VVSILLEGVKPHKAFFGSKDYQQVMVVKELVKQLHLSVDIVACPILREADGLAMSSRNTRLSADQRKTAALVPKIMAEAREIALQNEVVDAKAFVTDRISEQPTMKLDYYEICDAESLKAIAHISEARQAVSLIAVFVGNIRLIDNWMIN
jgi:pantoate--beta-alanine ligase